MTGVILFSRSFSASMRTERLSKVRPTHDRAQSIIGRVAILSRPRAAATSRAAFSRKRRDTLPSFVTTGNFIYLRIGRS
jgi:hypothetical protein